MKLIEKFSRLHHQEKKLKEILTQQSNEKWVICYLSHYDDPHFSVFQGGKKITKTLLFKLVESELVYVESSKDVTHEHLRETKVWLNDVLKTAHHEWTEMMI